MYLDEPKRPYFLLKFFLLNKLTRRINIFTIFKELKSLLWFFYLIN